MFCIHSFSLLLFLSPASTHPPTHPPPLQIRQAVLAHAVEGGLKSELFVELVDYLLPKWDAERVEG